MDVLPRCLLDGRLAGDGVRRFMPAFAEKRLPLVYLLAGATLALITWADYAASTELSFIVFYFGPISLAAWFGGRKSGLVFAVASTACWWLSDHFAPPPRQDAFSVYWETVTHFVAYLVMALGVSQLRSAMQRQHDLVRVVSHDLRSPLSALIGHAGLLLRRAEPGSWGASRAEAIVRAGQQMNAMIEELVEAARDHPRRRRLELKPVELRPFLDELLGRMSASLPCQRVDLELGDAPLAVDADPIRLERIVVNLLSNALRYSPERERVQVKAEPAGSRVVLSVVDHGPGIAPEDRVHLFERYYRGRASAGTEGVGLGLHGTQLLVKAHGGRLRVEEAPGGGAAFRVELPRATVPKPS
jgi:signal transduction histidine kinase